MATGEALRQRAGGGGSDGRQTDHRIASFLHESGLAADEATSEHDAVERTLHAVCAATDSSLTFAHIFSPDGALGTTFAVHLDAPAVACSPEREARFPITRARRVEEILRNRDPVSIGRVDVVAGEEEACAVTRLGVPVAAGTQRIGAIEILLPSAQPVADTLLVALGDVGRHLARTIERIRLEQRTAREHEETIAFAARAAHELRSPIAAARLAASTLTGRGDRLSDDDRAALLSTIERSMVQLGGLVRRLTDLADAGTDRATDVQPVEVEPVLRGLVADLDPTLQHTVAVIVDNDVVARADRVALNEILTNLVTNAARHGSGMVTITATRTDAAVVIRVADDGPGVPPDIAERVFEPFVRGQRHRGGFGIGLTISRRLARSMGGDLTHEPVEPHGAAFVLTLPRAT